MDALLQDLPFNPADLHGLSDKLLVSHHRNNYGGAVKRLNAIRAELAGIVEALGFQPMPEAGEAAFARARHPARPAAREERAGRRRATAALPHSPFAVLAGLKVAP